MKGVAEVKLRPAESRDTQVIAELAVQLGYDRSPDQIRAWMETIAERQDQAAFVAEVAGTVVAWIEVSLERRLQSEIFGMIGGLVVKDGVRGQGIGRLLCNQAEEWSRAQGAGKIRVTSRNTREAAHRFYLRDGYEVVKTSLVFEKPLDR